MARTLVRDRKKWKKARHLEWHKKTQEYRGCRWRGVFWTSEVCPHFCVNQFKFGEPEFVSTTERSQRKRIRKKFYIEHFRKGSVITYSSINPSFCRYHFAIPTEASFLESIPVQLLHPEFLAIVVPVTTYFEKINCQVGLIHQVPLKRFPEWQYTKEA